MIRIQKIFAGVALVASILACSLLGNASPGGSNPGASASAGTGFNVAPLSGALPIGLGSGVQSTTTQAVEFPYIDPSAGDMPQHLKLTITNYPHGNEAFAPTLLEFRAGEYTQYSELTHTTIETLKQMLGNPDPALAPKLFASSFHSQVKIVNFANGVGMRYVGQVMQAPLPINNNDLIYYYQGLTSDGMYYIEALLPLGAPDMLANDANRATTLPPQGIAFPWDSPSGAGLYFETVSKQIDGALPASFSPSLDALDQLVQSLKIAP